LESFDDEDREEAKRNLRQLTSALTNTHPELAKLVSDEVASTIMEGDTKKLRELHDRIIRQAKELALVTQNKVEKYLESLKEKYPEKTTQARGKMTSARDNPAQLEQIRVELELDCTDEQDLKSLGVEKHIDLLKHARNWANDAGKLELLKKLYRSIPLDPKFEEKDKELRKQVLSAIRGDQDIKTARTNWKKLSQDDKKLALSKALKLQWTQLGMEGDAPSIVINRKEPKKHAAGTVTENVEQGRYDKTSHKIELDCFMEGPDKQTEDSRSAMFDFDNALNTVVHETTHAYQYNLMDMLAKPEFKNDPRANQAMLFHLNRGKAYLRTQDDAYEKQPVERHAFLAGSEAQQLFSSTTI
jgi:hypothetical protein